MSALSLGVKPGDHVYMFAYVDQAAAKGDATEFTIPDKEKSDTLHCFRFLNQVPLNEANKDLLVNFLEYWQVNQDGEVVNRFSWVTDLEIIKENTMDIIRAGRSRWRIENETFNTLKNQGYNLGHMTALRS